MILLKMNHPDKLICAEAVVDVCGYKSLEFEQRDYLEPRQNVPIPHALGSPSEQHVTKLQIQ